MARTQRIPALEKFRWRGFEFKLSFATSTQVTWHMESKLLRMRLIYRDLDDAEAPPEYTAIIHAVGITSGEACAESAELAFAWAELDLKKKIVKATRLWSDLASRRARPRTGP